MKTKRKNRKPSKSVANIKQKRTMKLRNSKGAEYSYTAPKDITSCKHLAGVMLEKGHTVEFVQQVFERMQELDCPVNNKLSNTTPGKTLNAYFSVLTRQIGVGAAVIILLKDPICKLIMFGTNKILPNYFQKMWLTGSPEHKRYVLKYIFGLLKNSLSEIKGVLVTLARHAPSLLRGIPAVVSSNTGKIAAMFVVLLIIGRLAEHAGKYTLLQGKRLKNYAKHNLKNAKSNLRKKLISIATKLE